MDDFRHYSLFLLSFYLRQSGWQRTVLCVFLHRKRTEIHVFKKSSVIIKVSNKTILIDPATSINKDILGKLERNGLDLLMYTHAHYDHYDYTAAMEIFAATGAHIVASPEVAKELKRKIPKEKITVSTHRGKITQSGIDVTAIKGKYIGPIYLYHIAIGDVRIFHGGDSSYIPLSDYPSDVAFVPTGDPPPPVRPRKHSRWLRTLSPRWRWPSTDRLIRMNSSRPLCKTVLRILR